MVDRDRHEFLYDGTVEGAKKLIGFIWNSDFNTLVPKKSGDPKAGSQEIQTFNFHETIRPGDIVQRENWGEFHPMSDEPLFRYCVIRNRLQ